MSFTSPVYHFAEPSEDDQQMSVVLQRAASPWANFPNPNTHRFPVTRPMYLPPQPTAPRSRSPTTLGILQSFVDAPACFPLPPTPPPKSAQQSHSPPTPPSEPHIPDPQKIAPPLEPLPSSPRRLVPPDAFHLPPTLPRQSAFFPLNPRPRYIPTRDAPRPPDDVSPATAAFLRGPTRIDGTVKIRHRRWIPWIFGIFVLNCGVACFVIGITLLAINAPYDPPTVDAEKNVNIAAGALCIVGFSSMCGSAVHLIWLYHTRKSIGPQRHMPECRGTRTIAEAAQRSRTAIASNNSGPAFNAGFRRFSPRFARTPISTTAKTNKKHGRATGFISKPPDQDCSRGGYQKSRGEVSGGLAAIASFTSLSQPDSSRTRMEIEQVQQPHNPEVAEDITSRHDHASSVRTSFLDLEDEYDQNSVGGAAPVDTLEDDERISAQMAKPIPGSAGDPRATKSHQRQQQLQQMDVPAPFNPERERWKSTQWRGGESSMPRKGVTFWESGLAKSNFNQNEESSIRMQDIARYTSSVKRLRQDGLWQDQRFCSTEPLQGQAVHVPKLDIRARGDIAKALGPAIKRRAAAQTEHSRGKQKEEEIVLEDEYDDNVHGDTTVHSAYSNSPSDADLSELASLAARSSGFPSLPNLIPIPNPTSHSQVGKQRPSIHRRSLNDSQTLDTFRTSGSSPTSPTERGPGDLILRMRNAHKRSESASRIPSAREVVVGEGTEFMLAPLLPATAYIPNLTRPGADSSPAQSPARPTITRTTTIPRANADLAVAQRDLHARDIVPAIQANRASHLPTQHTVAAPPPSHAATISTVSSAYTPSPPIDAS